MNGLTLDSTRFHGRAVKVGGRLVAVLAWDAPVAPVVEHYEAMARALGVRASIQVRTYLGNP